MLGRVILLCLSERNTMEVFEKMASITEQMTCLRETLLKMQKQFKQLENTVKSFRPEQKWCPQCKRYLEFGMFYKNRNDPMVSAVYAKNVITEIEWPEATIGNKSPKPGGSRLRAL